MAFEDYDKVYNNKNVKTNIFYVSRNSISVLK